MSFLLKIFRRKDKKPLPSPIVNEKTLVLLGTSCAGKSSLLKQAIILFGDGYNNEAALVKGTIFHNILAYTEQLCRYAQNNVDEMFSCSIWKNSAERKVQFATVSSQLIRDAKADAMSQNTVSFTRDLYEKCVWLWRKCPEFRQFSIKNYKTLNIPEGVQEYFVRIREFEPDTYVATHKDIVYARVRTTGVNAHDNIAIGNCKYTFYDGTFLFVTLLKSDNSFLCVHVSCHKITWKRANCHFKAL